MRTTEDRHIEAVIDHVARHIGPVAHVFHVPGPALIHSDVIHVLPTRDRPRHTLITCGMSLRPMSPPGEAADCRFGEMFFSLPEEWSVRANRRAQRCAPWITELGQLARLPHLEEGWLWYGHTVRGPSLQEEIVPRSGFTAWILGPHMSLDHDTCVAQIGDRRVHFFSAVPIYREEWTLVRDSGSDALFRLLHLLGVDDELWLGRPNVAGSHRRRRRGRS